MNTETSSLGKPEPLASFNKELSKFTLTDETLAQAIDAANKILRDAGANALVESLGVSYVDGASITAGCKCVEYQTRCYPIKTCKNVDGKLVCTIENKCYRECVRWSCPT